jgi:predicted aspartyl protease
MLCAITLLLSVLSVPLEIDKQFGSILVQMEVNGKTATFLLDTGAASTFVSAELAGVDAFTLQKSRFRSNGGMEVRGTWERAKIRIGDWKTTMDVKAIDVTPISRRYGRRIDGLLGQDILRQFTRVTIDFEERTLVLSR